MLPGLWTLVSATSVAAATTETGTGDNHAARNIVIGAAISLLATVVLEVLRECLTVRRERANYQRDLIDQIQVTLSSLTQYATSLGVEFQLGSINRDERSNKRETLIDDLVADACSVDVLISRVLDARARAAVQETRAAVAALDVANTDNAEAAFTAAVRNLREVVGKTIDILGEVRRKM